MLICCGILLDFNSNLEVKQIKCYRLFTKLKFNLPEYIFIATLKVQQLYLMDRCETFH